MRNVEFFILLLLASLVAVHSNRVALKSKRESELELAFEQKARARQQVRGLQVPSVTRRQLASVILLLYKQSIVSFRVPSLDSTAVRRRATQLMSSLRPFMDAPLHSLNKENHNREGPTPRRVARYQHSSQHDSTRVLVRMRVD